MRTMFVDDVPLLHVMYLRRTSRFCALALLVLTFALPLQSLSCSSSPASTGLDPTQPLASVAFEGVDQTLTSNARQVARSVRLTAAFGNGSEIAVSLPYRESLTIDGLGTARGSGDAGVGYTRVLSCGTRWRTAAMLGVTLGTGNENFSAGSARFTPAYAVSYRVAKPLSIVLEPSYTFPLARAQGFPFTQTLGLIAQGILSLPRGEYAAAAAEQRHVSGDYRYDARLVTFTLGDVIARRYNASLFYEMPMTSFTYEHVEHAALGIRLGWQR